MQKNLKIIKSFQKSALVSIKGYIRLKYVNLNMILKETPSWGLPRSLSTKTRDKLYLFPQTLNSQQYCHPCINLNHFLLFPQTIPSKIPTGFFGPLPPQIFGLSLGRSSLTSKRITVHPGIIDSDYKGKIQIMMSSQIWK